MQHYVQEYKRTLTRTLLPTRSGYTLILSRAGDFFPQGQSTAGSYQGSYPGEGRGMGAPAAESKYSLMASD